MDVVKTNIEKIGGTIELTRAAGAGHHLHHQDPADAGHRLGADRRSRRRALRHPADQRRRTGARRASSGAERAGQRDRAHQRHPGAAPARPAAAAGQPEGAARASMAGRRPAKPPTIVVAQVGASHARHHRRPRVRHRGNRGQAGGADPAPRHDVQRQHHPGRRLGDHDPRSERHRARHRRRRRRNRGPCRRPTWKRRSAPTKRPRCCCSAPATGRAADGGAARPGGPAGGYPARQDRTLPAMRWSPSIAAS